MLFYNQVNVTDSITDDDYYEYEHYGTFDVTLSYSNCISDKSFTFTVDVDEVGQTVWCLEVHQFDHALTY
mgnify:CR=1 FL=1